ncbi:hypothetical protein sos41_31780 [Alphaproteobacteria bacterium SO-S41]|nr:hypothetical protein sos41_31780 [Alphaproteobacteria bacterium SO-S41]
MIVRIVVILTVLYAVLVCIGVAIVAGLQSQLGFLPALGVAVLAFLGVAWIVATLLLRRLRFLRSMAMFNAGDLMERLRNRRP